MVTLFPLAYSSTALTSASDGKGEELHPRRGDWGRRAGISPLLQRYVDDLVETVPNVTVMECGRPAS
jgi:hypothetical protein